MEEETVDLRRYLDVLLRWWWLLLLGPIVAGAAAYFFSINQTPKYEATTLVLVQQTQGSALPTLGDLQLSRALASTYQEVITTRPVLQAVAEDLDPSPSVSSLRDSLSVSLVPETSLLRLAATDEDPEQAATISNTLAGQFIRLTQENQLAEIARIQSFAASQGVSDSQDILAAQLNALASLQVVEPAVPPSAPVSPRITLNTLLAVLLGGFVSLVGVFTLEYLNDTARNPEEVERRTGLTRISTILRWRAREVPAGDIVALSHPRSSYAEAFRQARVNVQFLSLGPPPKRYLITSPGPGTGKTTFAVNFATSLTQDGKQVTLVDADLRRPGVHRYLSLDNQTGLSTLLANPDLDMSQVIQSTAVEGLHVLTSGPLPPNPPELLGSHRMDTILEKLGRIGDIVILDSPPVMAITDSTVLASKGAETILLADPDTRMEALRDSQKTLAKANTTILGFVLNKVRARRLGYGYYHYYYYYRSYDHEPRESQGQGSLLGRVVGSLHRREKG